MENLGLESLPVPIAILVFQRDTFCWDGVDVLSPVTAKECSCRGSPRLQEEEEKSRLPHEVERSRHDVYSQFNLI